MASCWRRLTAVDRAVWMTSAGALLLIAAALSPWSAHPSASLSSISPVGELRLVEEPYAIDLLLRVGTLLAALVFLMAAWRGVTPAPWQLRLGWLLPAVALALPCWLAHSQPERMLERRFLLHEINRVAEDMDENIAAQQTDWRAWQTLTPETVSNTPLVESEPTWQPAYFAPLHLHRVLEQVLGFSPESLAFFRPTLLAALAVGMGLVLWGLHLAQPAGLPAVWRGLGFGALVTAILLAAPLGQRIAAELHLLTAEAAQRRGDHAVAVEHLLAARSGKRGLAYTWAHYHRVGQLALLEDRPTSLEGLLAKAYDALTRDQPHAAVDLLHQARTFHPQATLVNRYLAVALSEAAIHAFNTGQISVAQDYWQESLQSLAINPMAWYGLSLVHARQQRYAEAAQALGQVARLQHYLGYKRMVIRAQVVVMASWDALQRGDLARAHALHSRSLRPETW